jgi:acyl carrier protein
VERADVMTVLRRTAVAYLDLEPEQVQEGLSFRTDLDVDSLALVEYTMAVEDELDIRMPDSEVLELTTISQFVDLILAKTAGRPAPDRST